MSRLDNAINEANKYNLIDFGNNKIEKSLKVEKGLVIKAPDAEYTICHKNFSSNLVIRLLRSIVNNEFFDDDATEYLKESVISIFNSYITTKEYIRVIILKINKVYAAYYYNYDYLSYVINMVDIRRDKTFKKRYLNKTVCVHYDEPQDVLVEIIDYILRNQKANKKYWIGEKISNECGNVYEKILKTYEIFKASEDEINDEVYHNNPYRLRNIWSI